MLDNNSIQDELVRLLPDFSVAVYDDIDLLLRMAETMIRIEGELYTMHFLLGRDTSHADVIALADKFRTAWQNAYPELATRRP
jgi:hypothetical protein